MDCRLEIAELEKDILKAKNKLNIWERQFKKNHGRQVTTKDIGERPDIRDYYKKYNRMKKDLQTLKKKQASQALSPSQPSQQRPSQSTESVEPPTTHREEKRTKESVQKENVQPEGSLQKVTLAEVEELKAILDGGAPQVFTHGGVTPDEFWLDDSSSNTSSSGYINFRAYASQPLPSAHLKSSPTTTEKATPQSSTQPPKKLILGGRPSPIQRKLSDRYNPFSRRHRINQQTQELLKEDKENAAHGGGTTTSSSSQQQQQYPPAILKRQKSRGTSSPREPLIFDDEGDDRMEIVEHKDDPFRLYDPSLFHWEDAEFSVGPGFFLGGKASTSFVVPFLADPARRDRVLLKLQKGTLGEANEENYAMEEDIEDDIRDFIDQHTIKPVTDSQPVPPLQPPRKRKIKRQTKLVKMKFVGAQ